MFAFNRKFGQAAFAVVGAAMLVMSGTTNASAAARNGVCDSGEFCYYWGANNTGSISDFTTSVPDYGTTQPTCYDFKGPGTGQGQCIKNNARSVWNRTSGIVRVYYNSNYGGTFQPIAAGYKGNLNSTLSDNNASHKFL
ncbi:peptidase inhibitor family I36 protein [Umezawaea sp. Da 62-37]|uniref:peptidase inhibitor family I36 protein n=1 Tax=Umezawaea sp. Da 62-37 TaxID=3075927 RepID=UPI0028F7352D|nr:peptidase inhibitor family I36 protein [Umezawaea sp. Da 62-37]WNV87268.1 peptidase inhibitor family I36 protein [Umezawaea sp. Da 62-37]